MPPPYCYDYPRPAVTVDLVIFGLDREGLQVLLIRRKQAPYQGHWALPGGFLEIDEPIEVGARRELMEETGFEATGPVFFLGVYGDPSRDPRGRTISMAHVSLVTSIPADLVGRDDASEAAWKPARAPDVSLAFDHNKMIGQALQWLYKGVRSEFLGLDILPDLFEEIDVRQMFLAMFDSTAGTFHWLRRMEKLGRIEPRAGTARLYRKIGCES